MSVASETIAIASRDRDFSHLARKLAEHGVHVVGIGPAGPDCPFRKACGDYREIGKPAPAPLCKPVPVPDELKLTQWLETVIGQADGKCISLTALSKIMDQRHGVTKAQLPVATWKAFLTAHPRFGVDAGAMVRLVKKKPPQDGALLPDKG